jgi:hypothetical protein
MQVGNGSARRVRRSLSLAGFAGGKARFRYRPDDKVYLNGR